MLNEKRYRNLFRAQLEYRSSKKKWSTSFLVVLNDIKFILDDQGGSSDQGPLKEIDRIATKC